MSRRDSVDRVNEGAGAAGKPLAPGEDAPHGHMAAGGAVCRGNDEGGRFWRTDTHGRAGTYKQNVPELQREHTAGSLAFVSVFHRVHLKQENPNCFITSGCPVYQVISKLRQRLLFHDRIKRKCEIVIFEC